MVALKNSCTLINKFSVELSNGHYWLYQHMEYCSDVFKEKNVYFINDKFVHNNTIIDISRYMEHFLILKIPGFRESLELISRS